MHRKVFLSLLFLFVVQLGWSQTSGEGSSHVGAEAYYSTSDPRPYWTVERMKKALRNPKMPIRQGEPMLRQSAPGDNEIHLSPPSGRGRDTLLDLPSLPPKKCDNLIACPVTRYEWSYNTNNRQYPQRVVGVLFFEDASGNSYVCSASLVDKKLLLTAGHCVSDAMGEWHQNFMWAPGYLDGELPFGQVFAKHAMTFDEWHNGGSFPFDVGFIITTEPVGNDLGWLGFITGGSPDFTTWRQHGYPAAEPYDGSKLAVNVSAYGARDCDGGSPCTIAVGSPFTGGSSGGPWIDVRELGPYANGLNSYGYRNCKENMYSPYFGQAVWNLLQDALGHQAVEAGGPMISAQILN